MDTMPTDSLFAVFVFAFVVSFGAVISPGPVSAMIVTEAPRQGWRVGPLVTFGHALLELLMVLLITLGLSVWMATPIVHTGIALVGGLLLSGIGISYIFAAWKGRIRLPQAETNTPTRSTFTLVILGIVATISNPFWYTWWITVAAGYLFQAQALGHAAVGVFYLGHTLADLSWDTTLALATSAGRRWLTNTRYRALILITGGFMLYLGVLFFYSALTGRNP
jgi:threonine/homoserine/homoserine lactone efflux protein